MALWVVLLIGIVIVLAALYKVMFGGRVQCRNCGCYITSNMDICPKCGCSQRELRGQGSDPDPRE